MDEELPNATLRTMGALIVAVYEITRERLHDVVERLRPLVEVPEDGLRVVSPIGGIYSGMLIIERNVVVAGIVIEVGRAPTREPVVTPPPRPLYDRPRSPLSGITDHFARNDGRLPGWADDPRLDPDEDEPWRRR